MTKFSHRFRLLTAAGTAVFIPVSFLLVVYASGGKGIPADRLGTLALSLLGYAVLTNLLSAIQARLFDTDFASLESDPPKYRRKLDELGALPLKNLLGFNFLTILFSLSMLWIGDQLGIPENLQSPLTTLLVSVGMVCSAFLYINGDNLVSKTLKKQTLHSYPEDLLYPRQRNKNFIIPVFILIMTMLFIFSVQHLEIELMLARGATITEFTLDGVMLSSLVLFLLIITWLVFLWTTGNSLIYKSLTNQLRKLTASEKNLADRIDIISVDELSFIAGRFNEFSRGLSVSVTDLKQVQTKLSSLGEELRAQGKSSATAVHQISSSVIEVNARAEAQSSSVQESSGAVEQIAKNIESLKNLISEQSSSVTQASASIEEMVGNINSITASANKMAEQFGELLSASAAGQQAQSDSDVRIAQIAERSKNLFEANQVIAAIAEQTNLLAMNAAIEAAHAGEAGKGFSVVADEIRKLAETSGEQSKNISKEIALVQRAIDDVVSASRGSEASYTKVVQLIGTTEAIVREVQQAMIEQKNGSMEILEALKSMNTITQEVLGGSKEMSAGNETVLRQIANLRDTSLRIRDSMEQMGRAAGDITGNVQRLNGLADSTVETISLMDRSLKSFRT